MKKVLVTGGAGYIGSHACLALSAAGYEPIVADNFSRGHEELVVGYKYYNVDLKNILDIEQVFAENEIHAVMHFAAFAYVGESVQNPYLYFSNNSISTLNLLEVMKRKGVRKIIFSSTCAVYGTPDVIPVSESQAERPESPYGMSKYINEMMIKSFFEGGHIDPVIFRYFNVVGNDAEFRAYEKHDPETHLLPLCIDSCISGQVLSVFGDDYPTHDGSCVRDYVDVRDLVDAHVLALSFCSKSDLFSDLIFNLGAGKGFTVLEVIKLVEEVTGCKANLNITNRRSGDATALYANSNKAEKLLGWQPKFNLKDSIIARFRFIEECP